MHGNHLHFSVHGGNVRVQSLRQYESRGDCCLEMLCDLVLNWPDLFEGCEGTVYFGDRPPEKPMDLPGLNFCSTTLRNSPVAWLPFPCPMALRWPQIGVPDAEGMFDHMLGDQRDWESDRVFWIGTDQHPSRVALAELSRRHPGRLDAELMEWNRQDPQSLKSKSRQVSIPDHRLFKYLVDCPGRGYSARLKWLLATGRPVFVVDRDVVEPWHEELEPWVHFVPVAADLTDLLEHLDRLEGDQDLAQDIGRNGREFADRRLRMEAQLTAVAEKLRAVSGTIATPAPTI
jgi:hypothetical protein